MTIYWRLTFAFFALPSAWAYSADPLATPGAPPMTPIAQPAVAPSVPEGKVGEAKKLNLDSLKQKYWGNVSAGQPLRVVQNRAFAKARRWNLGLSAGTVSNDPFLNTYSYGVNVGYNFSEYLAFHLTYTKASNSYSSAFNALVQAQGYGSNSNPISSILGGHLKWSVLYGKLSLAGIAIIHFDLYGFLGAGYINTQNGKSIAPYLGVGQQLFLTHSLSLNFDYRIYRYGEKIVQLYTPISKGQVIGSRTNYAGAFTLGINLFF